MTAPSSKSLLPVLSRFAFIGDVHTEHEYLEKAIEFSFGQGVDTVLCTGDIPDGYGNADRCCEILGGTNIFTVSGNHERWLLEGVKLNFSDGTHLDDLSADSVAFLRSLPRTIRFDSIAGPVLLCHGLYDNDMGKANFDDPEYILDQNHELAVLLESTDARIILNGHTHRFQVGYFRSRCFVNAGTIYRNSGPQFHIMDLEQKCIESYDFSMTGVVKRAHQTLNLPN